MSNFIVTDEYKSIGIRGTQEVKDQLSDADTAEGRATKLLQVTFKIKNHDDSYYTLGTAVLFKALFSFVNTTSSNITSTTSSVVAKLDWIASEEVFRDTFKLADNDALIGKYLSYQVTDTRASTFKMHSVEKVLSITHSETPAETTARLVDLKSTQTQLNTKITGLQNSLDDFNIIAGGLVIT